MNKSEYLIDLSLQEHTCSVLSPGNRFHRDEFGVITDKIMRNGENLVKLENTISTRMQVLFQKSISDILENQVPILYVDCTKKGDDDILFFLFKECMSKATIENKEEVASKIIETRTIITDDRNKLILNNQGGLEGIFNYYHQQLKKHIDMKDAEHINNLLNYEGNICLDGLINLMQNQNTKYLYLYLDKIDNITIDEQTRINTFLYSRGSIGDNKWIRLKLNNGSKGWKTRKTASGHRAEATHDYTEKHIYEEDL